MNLEKFTTAIFYIALGFILGIVIGNIASKNGSTPVEKIEVVDSLTKVNDSIKLKVENLDSIKDAKVIEVSSLSNDSTLKLFYELVKE